MPNDPANLTAKWERLSARDPEGVSVNSRAQWNASRSTWCLDFLNDVIEIDLESRAAGFLRSREVPAREQVLLALEYLACARDVPLSGRWVSGSQLPGGEFFFRGPHAIPSEPVAARFGSAPGEFLERARHLGGEIKSSGEMPGDAAACFRVLPRVEIAVVLWTADDEFPARATILFDASICEHLQLDGVLLAASVLVRKLTGEGGAS